MPHQGKGGLVHMASSAVHTGKPSLLYLWALSTSQLSSCGAVVPCCSNAVILCHICSERLQAAVNATLTSTYRREFVE